MTDFVHTKIQAADVKEVKHEYVVSTKQTDQEDRLSDLPDDILSTILQRLQLLEAARTSVLSRRWRHLFSFRPRLQIDVGAFHCKDHEGSTLAPDDLSRRNTSVVEATKSMLARSRQYPINFLRIRFHWVEESIELIRSVDGALANRKIAAVHFLILPEGPDRGDTMKDELITNGRHFMRFIDAGPRAFASISYLQIHYLKLNIDGVVNVLSICKKLEHLVLVRCESRHKEEVLQIEHPQLTTLEVDRCVFWKIELSWLPSLKSFTYMTWFSSQGQDPLSLGYVPQLSTLKLSNQVSSFHKNIRLSELQGNASIISLDLDFECERIWIEPEGPKVLGPLFRNLQVLSLQCIHEECDLDWTMFVLEAAPLLKDVFIKVWEHTCYCEEECGEWQDWFNKGDNLPTWEAPADLKHYKLKVITIKGYQVEEKFSRYIRRVVGAAVNLELLLLIHSL